MNTPTTCRTRAAWLALALGLAMLVPTAGCGRYGPPERAPEFREEGSRVTPATSAMGRGSERADEASEDDE